MLDVSVVVPFFNPGANIEDCLSSLAAQSLAADRYEVILVDDGSSDGSERRVQRYVDARPDQFRLLRIPASGWPGRPRNVGIDAAAGRYVQFVDSDDSLDPGALERMLEIALSSDADIVVGKLSSDFRGLNHHVFRHTVTGRTIHDYPLVDTLTPHKMVRKRLLVDHAIRFAEGPRHVEDEHFSMQIYTQATSVAVVGDLACYFYRRRRVAGRNLGDTEAAATEYFRDLSAVLDVIDRQVSDPAARIPLQRRFYRTEMLGRLRGRAMREYAGSYRSEVLHGVRALTDRFAPEVRDGLPFLVRAQSGLVLRGDLDALIAYCSWLDELSLVATVATPSWLDGRLVVAVSATLHAGAEPLLLDRDGADWLLPEAAAAGAPRHDRLVTGADLSGVDLDCATISRADSQQWSTTSGLQLAITDAGTVTISGQVAIDPATLQGNRPLDAGLWDLRLRVSFGGLTFGAALHPADDQRQPATWLLPTDDGPRATAPFWTAPTRALALDVDQWSHPLTELVEVGTPVIDGRHLEILVPAACGPTASYPAALALLAVDDTSPPTELAAELAVTPAGAALRVKLPRRLPGSGWRPWLRLGAPGGPPPAPLPWLLIRDGKRLAIRR